MPVQLSEDSLRARTFLETHCVGILATASRAGIPHAAAIYFVVEPDLSIRFLTKEQTTKCRNLQENPHAALGVFDANSQTTVQITGITSQIDKPSVIDDIFTRIVRITHTTSGNHQPPITKLNAGKYIGYSLNPDTMRMAEFIKAEYPPSSDQLFDVIVTPPGTALE